MYVREIVRLLTWFLTCCSRISHLIFYAITNHEVRTFTIKWETQGKYIKENGKGKIKGRYQDKLYLFVRHV